MCRPSQEGLYREQLRLSQELQAESARIQEQKTEVRGQLEAAVTSRQSLEEQLQRLQRENTQLQVCVCVCMCGPRDTAWQRGKEGVRFSSHDTNGQEYCLY